MVLSYDTTGVEEMLETAGNVAEGYAFFFENIYYIILFAVLTGIILLLIFVAILDVYSMLKKQQKLLKEQAEKQTAENYAIISVLEDILKELKTKDPEKHKEYVDKITLSRRTPPKQ